MDLEFHFHGPLFEYHGSRDTTADGGEPTEPLPNEQGRTGLAAVIGLAALVVIAYLVRHRRTASATDEDHE